MADRSDIEWTEATWNPIAGCSVASTGCAKCYAMRRVAPRLAANPATPHYAGTVEPSKAGPVWTGRINIASDRVLTAPLRWKKPRTIFVNSTSDLFHEGVPDEVIDRIFAVMALCPQHIFQVLTKRSKRMRGYACGFSCDGARRLNIANAAGKMMEDGDNASDYVANAPWPLPNVWLGVSAERQQEADERVPELLATPAAIRFVSAEPLLGPIDFTALKPHEGSRLFGFPIVDALRGVHMSREHPVGPIEPGYLHLDWIIVGGESGSGARPMHPDWARSIRDQCAAAGVPFFFKQWGEWGNAHPQPAGTPGKYAIASAQLHSDFWPQLVHQYDEYPRQINLFGGAMVRELVGKKAAGRRLDGVEHNAMPEAKNG